MSDYIMILRNEFAAGEQSFLLQLRAYRTWDEAAFTRLITAMRTYCLHHAGEDVVERWIAQGFWYIPIFTREWTTYPSYPRSHKEEYYTHAYQQLDDLAYWFFVGENPHQDEHTSGTM